MSKIINTRARILARAANALELQEGIVLARAKRDLKPATRFLAFREMKRQFAELTNDVGGELHEDLLSSARALVKQRREQRRENARRYAWCPEPSTPSCSPTSKSAPPDSESRPG